MDLRIFMEWDRECGFHLSKLYPLREGIENDINKNSYGSSIKEITIVLICRPYDFKQRKRFKKNAALFEYDILVDFYLVKNVESEEKKKTICYQMIKTTEETFKKYEFEDFATTAFLSDFKTAVESVQW